MTGSKMEGRSTVRALSHRVCLVLLQFRPTCGISPQPRKLQFALPPAILRGCFWEERSRISPPDPERVASLRRGLDRNYQDYYDLVRCGNNVGLRIQF
jgi:hypothetical protein